MSELLFHERLGRGGYGEVYRATWFRPEDQDRTVAVKVLNAAVGRGSDAQRRLRDEARLLGSVRHPNILRVYDLTDLEGHVAMVAEFVPGEDLDRCVLDGLPHRALLEALAQVATALSVAWNAPSKETGKPLRLVHRDIKPENLRIRPDGVVKILDFGVARAAEMRREAQTATNTVMGSYRYMAPERFDDGLSPDPSMDVFALGCILYEGLAYRRLFEHLSMREMMVLSLPDHDRYPNYISERLEELPDTTDARLINLIHRLVDRKADRRPSPGEVAKLLLKTAEQTDGESLATWVAGRDWTPGRAGEGVWTGKTVDLPLKSEFLGGGLPFEDFTPTPSALPDLGRDYEPPAENDDELEEAPLPNDDPVTLSPEEIPWSDDVTVRLAVDSLNAATSTPTGSDQRVVPPVPAPDDDDPPANAKPKTELVNMEDLHADPEAELLALLDDEEAMDDLRRAIGIDIPSTPDSFTPQEPEGPSADRKAILANLAVLALLAGVGLVILVLIVLVVLQG